ncbi:MAG: RHS repeat-associated core domain-containing protein [Acidobacteriota bacterium]
MQPTQIGLGTSSSDSSLLRLDYTYGTSDNNGNVVSQRIVLTGLDVTQSYTYDQVNRLLSAEEKTTSTQAQQWKQAFTYDQFGNRNFDVANTTLLEANPSISSSTNRINAANYLYDAAGNVTQEPSSPANKTYIYDGENHQIKFTVSSQTTSYEYDGDGRRVRKVNPNASYLIFVYDAGGRLVAEYDSGTSAPSAYQTNFLTQDHLGSTRAVSDATGAVTSRLDYLPFGTEISAGIGGRTTAMMYSASSTLRQKFTGYERDEESKLDFAQARYCSSVTGRFMSVDPALESVTVNNAQSWNRYAYVFNNPLRFIDPLGLWTIETYGVFRVTEVEENGKKVQKKERIGTKIVVTRSKGDDGESLLKQLGISKNSEQGKAILESVGNANEVQLSTLGGYVGEFFSAVENFLTKQAQGPLTDKGGPKVQGYFNCAETCARLAFPGQTLGGDLYSGPDYIDSLLKKQKNISADEAGVGDPIRYADKNNLGQHYASFAFREENGNIKVFSRSGQNGPFEFVDAKLLEGSSYGTIRGIGKDRTGFYSRTTRR